MATAPKYPPAPQPIANPNDGFKVDRTWLAFFQALVTQGAAAGSVTHTGTLTANELVVGNGAADIKVVPATNGQVPIGKTSDGSVTLATLTAGANITITNGAASIAIATSAGTVTTTGTPAAGNLTKFSGAATITNGDLSGDVSTTGTLVTTIGALKVATGMIQASAVTYAKIQNVSATQRMLGRNTAGAGVVEEVTMSQALDWL